MDHQNSLLGGDKGVGPKKNPCFFNLFEKTILY
jgi:hypothetical protein